MWQTAARRFAAYGGDSERERRRVKATRVVQAQEATKALVVGTQSLELALELGGNRGAVGSHIRYRTRASLSRGVGRLIGPANGYPRLAEPVTP